MDDALTTPPLVLALQLTEEQRRQIQQQTGYRIAAIPFASSASTIRCRFGGITLRVTRGVFVPAAVTEHLLRITLEAVADHERPVIVDVGTGSGAMALALASALPGSSLYASDVSDEALRCARRNRARLGLHNVRFMRGSLLSPIPRSLRGRVAAIVANVPYVPPHLSGALAHAFPTGTAIGMGLDGLDLVRELASAARAYLMPGGSLLLQLVGFQWPDFAEELLELGYDSPQLQGNALDAPVAGRVRWRG